MARHERNFRETSDEPLNLHELLALLGNAESGELGSREDMIARVLSAEEGWQEAVKRLGGAFAEEEAGLRDRKDG